MQQIVFTNYNPIKRNLHAFIFYFEIRKNFLIEFLLFSFFPLVEAEAVATNSTPEKNKRPKVF